jgi:serine/threonine protein kinase
MENDFEHALPIGTILADEYRIDRILGAGGFGITYRARDVKLDIDVAIKEYYPRDFASRANTVTVGPRSRSDVDQFQWGLSQFIEEARRLARLQHPNIVRCMRYFEANNTGYFVMTFEEGRTLDKYFPKPPQQSELDQLLKPLLDALEALHGAGIFHRDLSPDNILIRDDDTPVLIDFGASRQAMARRTQTVAAIVKPGYSPIEQYDRETRQQGAWSDIYALGATIYDIIAGGPPPDALSRIRNDTYIPARNAARGAYRGDFLDAIDWALQPDPDERPVTVREWRRKLLPNPSQRQSPAAAGSVPNAGNKTLATRFFGKEPKANKPAAPGRKEATVSGLRWPDYVLRGAAIVMLGVFLIRTFAHKEETPPQEVAKSSEPVVIVADDEERRLPLLSSNAEGVWNRVELVMRRQGHLYGSGTATLTDIRNALKSYQSSLGEPRTGALNQRILNRIMEEEVELPPYTVPGAAPYGSWYFEQTQNLCRITSGATRIEGRTLLTQRPFLRFKADRKENNGDGSMDVAFATPDLFDTNSSITMSGAGNHHLLSYYKNPESGQIQDIIMGGGDGDSARKVTLMLSQHKGEVVETGTSAHGGSLKLTFSTDGFEDAFRAMATQCDRSILYWIADSWGAVAQDDDMTVWESISHGSEQEAKDAAMKRCTDGSQKGGCKELSVFQNSCWAVSTGQKAKNDWVQGWAYDPTLQTAKDNSLQSCANEGGKDCYLVMHICADGTNEWHNSN